MVQSYSTESSLTSYLKFQKIHFVEDFSEITNIAADSVPYFPVRFFQIESQMMFNSLNSLAPKASVGIKNPCNFVISRHAQLITT